MLGRVGLGGVSRRPCELGHIRGRQGVEGVAGLAAVLGVGQPCLVPQRPCLALAFCHLCFQVRQLHFPDAVEVLTTADVTRLGVWPTQPLSFHGDLPLEQSLGLYERGVQLSRFCHARLEEAERRIEVLTDRGELKPAPASLTADPDR